MSSTTMETRKSRRKRIWLEQAASIVTDDRISNLPVEVIHEIISLLPARAAARLSVLSRKWQYFYETLRCINFNLEEFRDENGMILHGKIDQFMSRRLSIKNPYELQKVKVATHSLFYAKLKNHIDKCIELAIQGRIQELDLSFWHKHRLGCAPFTVPSKFFQSQPQLTVLNLEGCRVSENGILGFPLLKILSLKHSQINNDNLFNMVYGCPRLESLILESCHKLGKVSLINHSLEMFAVRYCRGLGSFHMNLPLLHTFEYSGATDKNQHFEWFSILDFENPKDVILSSTRVADLSYIVMEMENLQHLFSLFPNLSDVKMKHCYIFNGNQAVPGNVKKLTVVDGRFPHKLIRGFASSLEYLCWQNNDHFLGLSDCIPSGGLEFVHLISLTLGGFFILSDEALECLISHCPILENLNLRNCICSRVLKIVSRVLKTLVIEANPRGEGNKMEAVEILSPYLLSFVYDGPLVTFSQAVVSKKLICLLHIRTFSRNDPDTWTLEIRDIVERFREANKLTFATGSIELLFLNEEARQVRSWLNWSHIKLRVDRSYICYLDVVSLLHSSLCCTTLSIELRSSSIQLKFEDPTQLDEWNLHLGPVHDCIRDHLVEASFDDFDVNVHALRLVEHLLLTAEHLRKLVICMKARLHAMDHYGDISVEEMITQIPYVSRRCQILVITP